MPNPQPAPSQNRCECVRCGSCSGGYIHDPFDYMGDGMELCMDCDGSGITEECDYCLEAAERYQDEYVY